MKIALVTRRYPPLIGGAERVLSYLAPALCEEGAEVVVLTSRPEGVPGQSSSNFGRINGDRPGSAADVPVPLDPLDPSTLPRPRERGPRERGQAPDGYLGSLSPFPGYQVVRLRTSTARFVGTWLYMRELARWFSRNPVDLAYVSMLKHDAYVVVGEGKRRGFPVVLRPEGAGATGDLAWQGWGRFGGAIGRRCVEADAFVSISPAVRGELIAGGYDPSKIHDLPNGVPVPEIPWKPRGDLASLRVAFVGRLAPEKGLHALVDAWPMVLRAKPGARLTLIGEGPERPSLADRIARLGLVGSVELPGIAADPSEILRESDLFVLPSREEGMSIALLEAMALGIPSVASAIPGNLALMDDRVHGRLSPPDDPSALARAILGHSDDPLAPRLAEAARRRVIEHYSIAAVARRHLDLFRTLVDHRRPPNPPRP